jgi:hypothetical protein
MNVMSKRKQKTKKKAEKEGNSRHLDYSEFLAVMKRIAIVLPMRKDSQS